MTTSSPNLNFAGRKIFFEDFLITLRRRIWPKNGFSRDSFFSYKAWVTEPSNVAATSLLPFSVPPAPGDLRIVTDCCGPLGEVG